MDRHALIATLPELKRDLASAERRVHEAQQEVDALRSIVDGIEMLTTGRPMLMKRMMTAHEQDLAMPMDGVHRFPNTGTMGSVVEGPEDVPRGVEAVRRVMSDGRSWRLQAIIAEVIRRGWIKPGSSNPESAIRENVRRLARMGGVEKVAHATYRLVSEDVPESVGTSTIQEGDHD